MRVAYDRGGRRRQTSLGRSGDETERIKAGFGRGPPRAEAAARIGGDADDLVAVEIDGLAWLESAPGFVATVIDERGAPVRLSTVDPRVYAIHKLWLSKRDDREPIRRRRDAEQASAVAGLVTTYMPQLAVGRDALRISPASLVDTAAPLFTQGASLQ